MRNNCRNPQTEKSGCVAFGEREQQSADVARGLQKSGSRSTGTESTNVCRW
jgi:hypothetical protein